MASLYGANSVQTRTLWKLTAYFHKTEVLKLEHLAKFNIVAANTGAKMFKTNVVIV